MRSLNAACARDLYIIKFILKGKEDALQSVAWRKGEAVAADSLQTFFSKAKL